MVLPWAFAGVPAPNRLRIPSTNMPNFFTRMGSPGSEPYSESGHEHEIVQPAAYLAGRGRRRDHLLRERRNVVACVQAEQAVPAGFEFHTGAEAYFGLDLVGMGQDRHVAERLKGRFVPRAPEQPGAGAAREKGPYRRIRR